MKQGQREGGGGIPLAWKRSFKGPGLRHVCRSYIGSARIKYWKRERAENKMNSPRMHVKALHRIYAPFVV